MYESYRICNTSWFPFCPDEPSCPSSCCNYGSCIPCMPMLFLCAQLPPPLNFFVLFHAQHPAFRTLSKKQRQLPKKRHKKKTYFHRLSTIAQSVVSVNRFSLHNPQYRIKFRIRRRRSSRGAAGHNRLLKFLRTYTLCKAPTRGYPQRRSSAAPPDFFLWKNWWT